MAQREVTLLACSDPHGSEAALEMLAKEAESGAYDAMIVCGDFTTFGTTEYTERFLGRFSLRIFAVPGNCDIPETVSVLEKHNASIHNVNAELSGWHFFGFGGALPSASGMPFEIEEDIIERSLRSVATPGAVMVTHCPAYGFNDLTRDGRHLGSKGILRVASEFTPALALSGHVHEARGRVLTKDTVFANPGPAKNGYYARVTLGETVDVQLEEKPMRRR